MSEHEKTHTRKSWIPALFFMVLGGVLTRYMETRGRKWIGKCKELRAGKHDSCCGDSKSATPT
jgi:hypothetical protein